MRQATTHDRQQVVTILTAAFGQEPHTRWLVSGSVDESSATQTQKKLRLLMEYAFNEALPHGLVFLTDNGKGAAIWKQVPAASGVPLLTNVRFAVRMGLRAMQRIIGMENFLEKQRPAQQPYWYLWMLGVLPDHQGQGLSSELLKPMLDRATENGIPVYLETATNPNVALYERKGFSVYQQHQPDKTQPLTVRLMRRTA